MGSAMGKCVFGHMWTVKAQIGHMWTVKAQINLCMQAVWPGLSLSANNTLNVWIKGRSWYFVQDDLMALITKTHPFKYMYIENFTTQNWKFSDKISDIFHISAQKHRLWVLVRTASLRQF